MKRTQQHISRFAHDERGSMIVFCLFMFMVMLVLGGMAVDFMRMESKRVTLQGVADRAVIAAASHRHTKDTKEVAEDYFDKAGYSSEIEAASFSQILSGDTGLKLEVRTDISTFFLGFLDLDELETTINTKAEDVDANIEISFVSGSYFASKEERTEASDFAEGILNGKNSNAVSLSYIPISSSVNIGPDLYSKLNISTTYGHSGNCILFDNDDFNTTTFNTSKSYEKDQQFGATEHSEGNPIKYPLCGFDGKRQLIPVTNSFSAIDATIKKSDYYNKDGVKGVNVPFSPAIGSAVKWGVSLLDPSLRNTVQSLSATPTVAARPLNYDVNNNYKVLVIQTDYSIAPQRRLDESFYKRSLLDFLENDPLIKEVLLDKALKDYKTISDLLAKLPLKTIPTVFAEAINLLAEKPLDSKPSPINSIISLDKKITEINKLAVAISNGVKKDLKTPDKNKHIIIKKTAKAVADNTLKLCNEAKKQGIIIYTLAEDLDNRSLTTMAECASSPHHFFNVNDTTLTKKQAFSAITHHIQNLRLSL